jgi:hypothetical protein
MTAALGYLAAPALRARSRGRLGAVATVLAVVLPVPVLAALGLSLPLPATVERLAAKLVPFGDSTAFDAKGTRALAGGSIVLAPEERGVSQAASTASGGSTRSPLPLRSAGKPGKPATPIEPEARSSEPRGQTSHEASQKNGADPTASPSAPSESAPTNRGDPVPVPVPDAGGAQPGSDPSPAPEPKPTPVDTVTEAANTAVAPITNTVTNATNSVTDTAHDAVDTGTGALGGIKPP